MKYFYFTYLFFKIGFSIGRKGEKWSHCHSQRCPDGNGIHDLGTHRMTLQPTEPPQGPDPKQSTILWFCS